MHDGTSDIPPCSQYGGRFELASNLPLQSVSKIKPIWSKMKFTHKVTARNIFRYKKRMLMTIFGVAGAASILFVGFSVKYSISE